MTAEDVITELVSDFPDLVDPEVHQSRDMRALDRRLRGLLLCFIDNISLPLPTEVKELAQVSNSVALTAPTETTETKEPKATEIEDSEPALRPSGMRGRGEQSRVFRNGAYRTMARRAQDWFKARPAQWFTVTQIMEGLEQERHPDEPSLTRIQVYEAIYGVGSLRRRKSDTSKVLVEYAYFSSKANRDK